MTLPVAAEWFSTTTLEADVTQLLEPHVDELIRANLFHVRGRDADLMVDTGCGIVPLVPQLERLGLIDERPIIAVATHSHFDHVGGLHEFATRLAHPAEADLLAQPPGDATLLASGVPAVARDLLADAGMPLAEVLIDELPTPDYDPANYAIRPAPPTRLVEDGDVVELGDRRFEVLHLPGHSPGSIGLWDADAGILFSGDAIYDGPLLDHFPDANVNDYCNTMRRLRELPVDVVHGGHDPSFGRARLVEIADEYLALRGQTAS